MIPVTPQPPPLPDFVVEVANPGNAWLVARGYNAAMPLPNGAKPPAYWRACLPELHVRYDGVCAYLAVHIEIAAGGVSVDHFVAKSALAGLTYDWSNYRLACATMNARKRAFDDVLDPFLLPTAENVFHLELVSGRIFVNPAIAGPVANMAKATTDRLKLDNGINRSMRARHFSDYVTNEISTNILRRDSPFVYQEVLRQGLL